MKQVYRDWSRLEDEIRLFKDNPPEGKEPLLKKVMERGEIIEKSDMKKARELVLKQMDIIRKLKIENKFLT